MKRTTNTFLEKERDKTQEEKDKPREIFLDLDSLATRSLFVILRKNAKKVKAFYWGFALGLQKYRCKENGRKGW